MELLKTKAFPELASEYECTACLACENICPKKAINHHLADDGHVYMDIDPEKCVGCLKCQKICEKSRASYGVNDVSKSKVYAAWTTNEKDRANATSGGVFAALASAVLESGGCVIGAQLNGFECKHTVIYSREDIHQLQGSKYMASSMEDIYKVISDELPHRDVFFTGMGCQCAGVLAYFESFKTDHRLYTADLVCGGIPSRILIDKFKAQYLGVKGLLSFRSKDKYELKVMTDEGERVIKEKSLPLHGFNCGMTNRYCCYNCQFAKAHRKTDITIGDLWDYSVYPQEHEKGISILIAHTSTGTELLRKANLNAEETGWEKVLLSNKRIVCGKQNIYLPRKNLVRNSIKMKSDAFLKLYCINMSPGQPILFLFRIYRYIRERLLAKKNIAQIHRLLNPVRNREPGGEN